MNATARTGVWAHKIREKVTLIVDTNRNQIIVRFNGSPFVIDYPLGISVSTVHGIIDILYNEI